MRAEVNKDLAHIFLDYKIDKGTIIEVRHYASTLFTIVEPEEFAGINIDQRDIILEIIPTEENAFGNDCRNGACD